MLRVATLKAYGDVKHFIGILSTRSTNLDYHGYRIWVILKIFEFSVAYLPWPCKMYICSNFGSRS